jgi:hypothetical protein
LAGIMKVPTTMTITVSWMDFWMSTEWICTLAPVKSSLASASCAKVLQ